ncbi:MAG TPA: adenylosuccinate lyase [Candidatus Brocadiia bacterium]|nr:adenylosuccinate lyase [Candidatus Brocadiales bacterium]
MKDNQAKYDKYQNPLIERYASAEMCSNFSDKRKYSTWRRLWVALAETEKGLGLDIISDEQIQEMRKFEDDVNFDVANEYERKMKHEVMAHIHAYASQCPKARPIIHLGATSAYVMDNADLIMMRDGMKILQKALVNVIYALSSFAKRYANLPTLGFTHFQPAQLTTVGKRACLWVQDFILDLDDLEQRIDGLKFRGVKGTTGTQQSFMALFNQDEEKVKKLDELVTQKMGFNEAFPVTGQTYTRKVDTQALFVLAGIAQSAHKFANDIRLLQSLREIEEPFEEEQVGSSAMPYKRNPMRCERVTALARYVICNALNPAFTAASQWLERTLDDSANRRISIPEAFLATDAILNIVLNVSSGLVVYPKVIENRIRQELPFMVTEEILMAAVSAGGDRQVLHKRIQEHAMESIRLVKEEGKENDLLERIAKDTSFSILKGKLRERFANPEILVGRAPGQVHEFLKDIVKPILAKHKDLLGQVGDIRV